MIFVFTLKSDGSGYFNNIPPEISLRNSDNAVLTVAFKPSDTDHFTLDPARTTGGGWGGAGVDRRSPPAEHPESSSSSSAYSDGPQDSWPLSQPARLISPSLLS